MDNRMLGFLVSAFSLTLWCAADTQVWNDGGADNVWSTNAANWADGAVWANGNSAVFSGAGGTALGGVVDISATVTVANVTFQTNGYVIADADGDGLFLLAGAPSLFSVVNSNDTATVSRVIGGAGGLTKAGGGVLNLTTNNAYTGTTTVSAGVLRLARGNLMALGQVYAGTDTVVAAGATLDLNGAYVISPTGEKFTISGDGTDHKGALVNKGSDMTNRDLGWLTLLDNATIGGPGRIDIAGCTGNGKTLTKVGTHQLCMKNVADVEIVINEGQYTLLADYRALGGTTPGNTTVNGGTLNAWNTMTVPERITFNGGAISQGNPNMQLFTLSGYLTVNSNVNFTSSAITNGVEISGFVDGPGGFTQTSVGWCYFTGNTNSYTGPTVINGNCPLFVGKTNVYSGVLGQGVVTNNGKLYGYSSRIAQNNIVNNGSLYLCTGILTTAGCVINNNGLYIDRGGTFVLSNDFAGTAGIVYVRSNADVCVSSAFATNGQLRVGYGSFSLTNGAVFRFAGEIQFADRLNLGYVIDPTNVTGIINVPAGCTLYSQAITFGNGTNVVNGGMTGILNQAGTLITTGRAAEDNGIRLGHYPQAYTIYNMMAGTLVVGADYDLSCATDGTGWFNMTGGEVFTKRVMLNERDANIGYGRLTVSGGTLNVGSLTGSTLAISNAICADLYAPYLVELGGAGGTIRAVTNIQIYASNTLYGAGSSAITFDTTNWTITVSGKMAGAGGFNKRGSGDLVLSGTNTYSGPTCIYEGTVSPAAGYALPANGVLSFGVSESGTAGMLNLPDGFSLSPYTVDTANVKTLDEHQEYVIATWSGSLGGAFGASALPKPWYVYYDWGNRVAKLRAAVGTLIMLH